MVRIYPHPNLDEISLDKIFFALSDPIRLGIIKKLAQTESINSTDLVEGMPKSTLTHHTKILREAGLTRTNPEGRFCWISLRQDTLLEKYPQLLELLNLSINSDK